MIAQRSPVELKKEGQGEKWRGLDWMFASFECVRVPGKGKEGVGGMTKPVFLWLSEAADGMEDWGMGGGAERGAAAAGAEGEQQPECGSRVFKLLDGSRLFFYTSWAT